MQKTILDAINEAQLLGIFKDFCEKNKTPLSKNRLRNILANSSNEGKAISNIIAREYNEQLNDIELERMIELIKAFLKKSEFRKSISDELKIKLLTSQEYKCMFCGESISLNAHADHIVPFKYVGDELKNNMQMLCSSCNEKKNDSIDYQIRFLLKLV